MHNFLIVNADTDSISFCKQTGHEFSEEEQKNLLSELNSLYPEKIKFEHDGMFNSVVVVKAKNYCLRDQNGKVKVKGSGLKGTMKEKALQEFMYKTLNLLLDNKQSEVLELYNSYVKEIYNITDISRWVSKKTITKAVLNPERTNEQRVLDAIKNTPYQEGDKRYFYFIKDGSLKLEENWINDHDTENLVEKLHKTVEIFSTVLDMKQFIKFHLKGHPVKVALAELLGLPVPEKVKKERKKKVALQTSN